LIGVLVLYTCLLIGIVVSYAIARQQVIHSAQKELFDLSKHSLLQANQNSLEVNAALDAANRLPTLRCSEKDLEALRRLVFDSAILKDAGRFENGQLLCSAEIGPVPLSAWHPHLLLKTWDGLEIYTNSGATDSRNKPISILHKGDTYINAGVISPIHMGPHGIEFFDVLWDASGHAAGIPNPALSWIFTQTGVYRNANKIYATNCSTERRHCQTAVKTVAMALHDERSMMETAVFSGGATGILLGLALILWQLRTRTMESQLARAIRNNDLYVEYQPIVHMEDRRVQGVEVLCRWKDEHDESISPEWFIPIAEARHWIHTLTRNVFRQAIGEWAAFLQHNPDFELSINLSAYCLDEPGFVFFLRNLLARHAVQPQAIVIEITESATANDPGMIEQIQQLRSMGHAVRLDDFGTGYCSLSYLHQLKVDAIKVDRVFTRAIGTDSVTTGILPQIFSIADSQGLDVIVEGVEEEAQATYLTTLPFHGKLMGQGWLFGRPTSARNIRTMLLREQAQSEENASIGEQTLP
jgi:sensor c-di-GMP phosphodiesterase-like protein